MTLHYLKKMKKIGGSLLTMNKSGRLPSSVLDEVIEGLNKKGVKFVTGKEIASEEALKAEGFDEVVIGYVKEEAKASNPAVKCGYGLLMGDDTDVSGKKVVIAGKNISIFDLAFYAKANNAESVVIAASKINEKSSAVKELIAEAKEKGIKVLTQLELISAEKKDDVTVTFLGGAGEEVILHCDEIFEGDSWSRSATIVAAAAKGVNEAARVDKALMGDKAVIEAVGAVTPVKKDDVLKRNGYIGDTKKALPEITTEEQTIKEASRCLKCGCGEGCQLCKTICSEFAIYNPKADKIEIHGDECVACGMCYNRCPNGNIEMVCTGVKV